MKTLRRLVISPRLITETIRKEQDAFALCASIPGVLEITNDYAVLPGLLDGLHLEKKPNGTWDLDENSIQQYVARKGYHNIHLVLSYADWEKLGINGHLLGQSQEMPDKQIITYGRWHKDMPYAKQVARYHTYPIRRLPEAAIGAWHELDHGLRNIWGVDPTTTHYHFYGYGSEHKITTKAYQNAHTPRRYVRTPDPYEAWRALPWHRLHDVSGVNVEEKIKTLKDKILELFGLKRIAEESVLLSKLQPLVRRKAEQLIIAMAKKGYALDVTSSYRSNEEQEMLYAQGRTKPGTIVTNARAGESLHNYGVAFDVAFMVNGKASWDNSHPWKLLGETGEALGLTWGGRWTSLEDRPHFELTLGYTIGDFKNGNVSYDRYR